MGLFKEVFPNISFWYLLNEKSKRITHRDLKFDNIFVSMEPSGRGGALRIGDFGFAVEQRRRRNSDDEGASLRHCGTYAYAAPEILRSKPYDAKETDVWSL